jgi:hypothetical protein
MKTTVTAILLSGFCFFAGIDHAFAQDGLFSIGPMGSADLYSVSFNKPPAFPPFRYQIKSGFSYGVSVSYAVTENFGLRGGFARAHRRYGIKYDWVYIQPNDPYIPEERTMNTVHNEFSAGAEYYLVKKEKMLLFVSASYCMGNLGREQEITEYSSGRKEKTVLLGTQPERWVNSFPFTAGIKLNMSKHFQLQAEPYFRYFTGPFEKGVTTSRPVQYGLSVSLGYLIKK